MIPFRERCSGGRSGHFGIANPGTAIKTIVLSAAVLVLVLERESQAGYQAAIDYEYDYEHERRAAPDLARPPEPGLRPSSNGQSLFPARCGAKFCFQAHMDNSARKPKKSWIGCLAVTVGCLAVFMLVCGGGMIYLSIPSSPRTVFENETGLKWPSNAKIVSSGANHGGFHGDGEFHVVFDVDQSELDYLLATHPRSPLSQWKSGPVPTEIGFHCSFGTDGVAAVSFDGGPTQYSGDEELEYVFGSSQILYSAHERCCDSLRWHNGTLLVVDPRNRRVWFSIWDF